MTWDAAVVLLRAPGGRVLGITRGSDLRDINLPGGLREAEDAVPADTARRELLEETGLELQALQPLGRWNARGRRVVAFQGLTWGGKLRPSQEGFPAWVPTERLTRPTCTYRRENGKLLGRL